MRNTGSYHCRGSAYVCVLAVAMLVTGIGLSALLAVRVERRTTSVTEAAVQARLSASSLIEVAFLRIAQDHRWRNTYTHDVWTSDETVDGVTYAFKLLDEHDGDLANDTNQPVRLFA